MIAESFFANSFDIPEYIFSELYNEMILAYRILDFSGKIWRKNNNNSTKFRSRTIFCLKKSKILGKHVQITRTGPRCPVADGDSYKKTNISAKCLITTISNLKKLRKNHLFIHKISLREDTYFETLGWGSPYKNWTYHW